MNGQPESPRTATEEPRGRGFSWQRLNGSSYKPLLVYKQSWEVVAFHGTTPKLSSPDMVSDLMSQNYAHTQSRNQSFRQKSPKAKKSSHMNTELLHSSHLTSSKYLTKIRKKNWKNASVVKSRHLKSLPFYPSLKVFLILPWMFCNKAHKYINIVLIPDSGLSDATVKSQYTLRLTVVLRMHKLQSILP